MFVFLAVPNPPNAVPRNVGYNVQNEDGEYDSIHDEQDGGDDDDDRSGNVVVSLREDRETSGTCISGFFKVF